MIDVVHDAEGVRQALEAIFEEDFVRSRVDVHRSGADAATRARMEQRIPRRVLSPGYYRWAEHLLRIDAERRAGVPLGALVAFEADGMVQVDRARAAFEGRHPKCTACGLRQENRFGVECPGCGAKFRKKNR